MALKTNDSLKYFRGRKMFLGIYPSDALPFILPRKPFGMIINLDKSYQSASHWVAVYCPEFGVALYFDFFENEPDYKTVVFLEINCKKYGWIANRSRLKGDLSIKCGMF